MKRILIALAVCAALVALLGYVYSPTIYTQLDAFKLIPRPEPFTELYFDAPQNLPKTIFKNEKISFSFTIHNVEGKDMNYHYRVYVTYGDGRTNAVDEQTIDLKNDAHATIPESFTLTQMSSTERVTIELPELDQNIDFLLNT